MMVLLQSSKPAFLHFSMVSWFK